MTPIYWIHMSTASNHRVQNLQRQIAAYPDFVHEIVEACTPGDGEVPLPTTQLSGPEDGCFRSHLKALRRGVDSGARWFFVCEDDFVWSEPPDLGFVLKHLPYDAEIAQLHCNHPEVVQGNYQFFYVNRGQKWTLWRPTWSSTGCYCVSREAAVRILEVIDGQIRVFPRIPTADDLMYSLAMTYTATRPFGVTLDLDSSIHEEHLSIQKRSSDAIRRMAK